MKLLNYCTLVNMYILFYHEKHITYVTVLVILSVDTEFLSLKKDTTFAR